MDLPPRTSAHRDTANAVEELPSSWDSDPTEELAVHDVVWMQVCALPPRQRAALVLRYYEDLTETETAEVLGCSVGTVKSQVSDALANLRKRVGPESAVLFPDDEAVTP